MWLFIFVVRVSTSGVSIKMKFSTNGASHVYAAERAAHYWWWSYFFLMGFSFSSTHGAKQTPFYYKIRVRAQWFLKHLNRRINFHLLPFTQEILLFGFKKSKLWSSSHPSPTIDIFYASISSSYIWGIC